MIRKIKQYFATRKYKKFNESLNFFNSWYQNNLGKIYHILSIDIYSGRLFMEEYQYFIDSKSCTTIIDYVGNNYRFDYDSFMSEHFQINSVYMFDDIIKSKFRKNGFKISNIDIDCLNTKDNGWYTFRISSEIKYNPTKRRLLVKSDSEELTCYESYKCYDITKKQLKKYFINGE